MHEIAEALAGCRIQRVDGPFPGAIALTLHRADRHGCLLLHAEAGRAAWGWLADRPRGAPASSFVQLLRKHLEGERVASVSIEDRGAAIAAGEATLWLTIDPADIVLEVAERIAGALRRPRTEERRSPPIAGDLASLERAGPEIAAGRGAARASTIVKAIEARCAKLERRLAAIAADLERAGEAQALRDRGSLLLAHLSSIPAGAAEAIVTNWNVDPPAPLKIAIDPRRGPKGEAEALFRKARKHERGAEIARSRGPQTEREIERLRELARRAAEPGEDLDAIAKEAARLGVRPQIAPRERKVERRVHRTFLGDRGRPIWVGRSAADNDALTIRIARPHDLFLHVRGASGSHVIVPLDRGEACPPELLVDAAHLAAHFSSVRGESPVEIAHAPRRHVRKPKGTPPGLVAVTQEKVMLLRLEPDRLERLLASEDHS